VPDRKIAPAFRAGDIPAAAETIAFRLAPRHDVERLATTFRSEGRVRIAGFLDDVSAEVLRAELAGRHDWKQMINSGNKLFELDRTTRAALSPDKSAALGAAVALGAREGFQHQYEAIRVPDDDVGRRAMGGALAAFARWLSGGAARALIRQITGRSDIAFADAQATAFAPGDFLTGHDDLVDGKGRRAAYVMGLTPIWRIEWGGLLMFHDETGESAHAIRPGFNTLDLFDVPRMHSVSLVGPAAPVIRHSVTGWLRARA
jgi:Rps23 Pro-64 3,4-dihydroxylase Tpa1-like proline 4-hydroxylase